METKEGLKRALMQETEAGVRKLLEHLQKLPEGDLKGLEQRVMETIFEIGRGWMQSVLSEAAPEEPAPGERVGSCGHPQQLVGYRPKQVLTLLGKITFKRAYYQCVVEEEGAQASLSSRQRLQRVSHFDLDQLFKLLALGGNLFSGDQRMAQLSFGGAIMKWQTDRDSDPEIIELI